MFNINGPSGPTSRNERPMRPPNEKKMTKRMKPHSAVYHGDQVADKENCISSIFEGCNFYFNGRTGNVSSYYLIKMVKAHGGNISTMHRKTKVTHVIAANLSGSKTDAVLKSGGRIHCVRAEWILESIDKGKRQPESKYGVCKDTTITSSGASFFQSGAS